MNRRDEVGMLRAVTFRASAGLRGGTELKSAYSERVKFPSHLAFLCAVLALLPPDSLFGQGASTPGAEEFRTFTPKEGNPLEAKLLSVSRDYREMEIMTPDGKKFRTPIVKLILDDQQYVKDWLKTRPQTADYNLDVKIERNYGKEDRRRYGSSYVMESKPLNYTIRLRNLSNEVLPAPKVEYILLMKDGVSIYQSEGSWTYSEESRVRAKESMQTLQDMTYNREQAVTTESLKFDRIFYDGNDLYLSDEPYGVLVRVTTAQGVVITEARSSEEGNKKYKWEDAVALTKGGSSSSSSESEKRGPKTYRPLKGDHIEGPIDLSNRKVEMKAKVSPSGKGDGVIMAIGGFKRGLALYVQDQELRFVQNVDGDRKIAAAKLPLGEFVVKATLDGKQLKIEVDGRQVAEAEGKGAFEDYPSDGIDVGKDGNTDDYNVGPYPLGFRFAGTIREVEITLAADE
ncbi:MAG: hypothetical protein HKN23_07780 [Verrucomicrobiales bacterium]|nr:hypothetical protein [Verrucomicrobiales bacterium]